MKKLLMAAVAVTSIAATPAMAAGTSYDVAASVAPTCSISGAGASKIDFGLLTGSGGTFTAANSSPSVTDTNAYCNQAGTTVDITHTNLSTAHTSTGFASGVTFTPSISTAEHPTAISGDGTGYALGAFTTLTVAAAATAPTSPLVAGAYTGSITVTLHATS